MALYFQMDISDTSGASVTENFRRSPKICSCDSHLRSKQPSPKYPIWIQTGQHLGLGFQSGTPRRHLQLPGRWLSTWGIRRFPGAAESSGRPGRCGRPCSRSTLVKPEALSIGLKVDDITSIWFKHWVQSRKSTQKNGIEICYHQYSSIDSSKIISCQPGTSCTRDLRLDRSQERTASPLAQHEGQGSLMTCV